MPYLHAPSNSWEVSYVLLQKHPRMKLDVTPMELFSKLGDRRTRELSAWAERYCYYNWMVEHTVYRPYIKAEPVVEEFIFNK